MSLLSSPMVWIVAPIVLSLVLGLIHRLPKLSVWIVCIVSLLLGAAALMMPQSLQFRLFGINYVFGDTLKIFNR